MLLLPLLLELQIPRQLVIGICIGFLRCPLATLYYVDGLILHRVEVRAEIEVIVHGEVLEGVLSDLILRLITPWEDIEILILSVLFVDPLESLLSNGPLNLCLGLSEGEIREFLIHKQPTRVLLDKLYQAFIIIDSLILVNPLDLDTNPISFRLYIILKDELVLVTVLQHVLNG